MIHAHPLLSINLLVLADVSTADGWYSLFVLFPIAHVILVLYFFFSLSQSPLFIFLINSLNDYILHTTICTQCNWIQSRLKSLKLNTHGIGKSYKKSVIGNSQFHKKKQWYSDKWCEDRISKHLHFIYFFVCNIRLIIFLVIEVKHRMFDQWCTFK